MSQQRQDGHGDKPREGERNEQDVTEQRVEVQGEGGGSGRPNQSRANGGTAAERRGEPAGIGFTGWFTSAAIRTVLVIVGLVVLLFALGQAVGIDLLGLAAEALSSELGRWLLIAAFGLVLIGLAQRGFRSR
jgi:hypothetical protein